MTIAEKLRNIRDSSMEMIVNREEGSHTSVERTKSARMRESSMVEQASFPINAAESILLEGSCDGKMQRGEEADPK